MKRFCIAILGATGSIGRDVTHWLGAAGYTLRLGARQTEVLLGPVHIISMCPAMRRYGICCNKHRPAQGAGPQYSRPACCRSWPI